VEVAIIINIEVVVKQISRLKYLLSLPSTDVCWSTYNSALEVIDELELLRTQIEKQDKSAMNRLLFLLAPTGSLQEISLSSGWSYEFLEIADALENALGKRI